jgi:hypothetical protein
MTMTDTYAAAPRTTAEAFHDALRAAADLIKSNPILADLYPSVGQGKISLHYWGDDAEHLAEISRAIPGTMAKNDPSKGGFHETYYTLTSDRKVEGLTVIVTAFRDSVCERVLLHSKTVEHPATPALEAREAYTDTVPVYGYECKPLNKAASK